MIQQNLRLMELPGFFPAFCLSISAFPSLFISLDVKNGGGYSSILIPDTIALENGI